MMTSPTPREGFDKFGLAFDGPLNLQPVELEPGQTTLAHQHFTYFVFRAYFPIDGSKEVAAFAFLVPEEYGPRGADWLRAFVAAKMFAALMLPDPHAGRLVHGLMLETTKELTPEGHIKDIRATQQAYEVGPNGRLRELKERARVQNSEDVPVGVACRTMVVLLAMVASPFIREMAKKTAEKQGWPTE